MDLGGYMAEKIKKDGACYFPSPSIQEKAHLKSFSEYEDLYRKSIEDPEAFWSDKAKDFVWGKTWSKARDFNYDLREGPVHIRWFSGAETNMAVNCLDRHLETKGDKTALIWEGNECGESKKFSYRELHREVSKFANVLESKGIVKGDRVAIYMPMIPELTIAVLACARIGAVHSVVFGGFSSQSLADRIEDSSCTMLITSNGSFRGKKFVPLKENADAAMEICEKKGHQVKTCIVVLRVKKDYSMKEGRDFDWCELMKEASPEHKAPFMKAEDPLFILYTSGSTGKPKGVLHATAGYMVYVATTFRYVFDHREEDIYWCTADIGWITGHSYIIYGPLLNASTTIMFEGVPNYPDFGRFWQIVEKYKVNVFYTAPTAIRSLEAQGDGFVKKYDRSSLRLLGTVGEPINPAAWEWYHKVVGEERCPIVDTWWQTETGGILITALPGAIPTKPGSATKAFFGVEAVVLDPETGKELEGEAAGVLAIKKTWPGQMVTVYGDPKRFEDTYFSAYKGYYFSGDACRRDKDGYYWITGRVDDVLNVSGHRFGTAEIESALVSFEGVSEAAVVGFPHNIKGQGIYAYVTLASGLSYDDEMKKKISQHVREVIGPIASPDIIHWAPGLPKTRSGKIMRRILRKIATKEDKDIGDTTTLADPQVVEDLISNRP